MKVRKQSHISKGRFSMAAASSFFQGKKANNTESVVLNSDNTIQNFAGMAFDNGP